MIKTAQDAYLAGRQAAMMKLADVRPDEVGGMSIPGSEGFLGAQSDILRNIGLSRQGLIAEPSDGMGDYDPMRLATLENLSRAGMLTGAAGGAYLGGMDPRAAAIASAGALGGGIVGGNLGAGVNAALAELGLNKGHGLDDRTMQSLGGALGGLGGGLGAGYLAR